MGALTFKEIKHFHTSTFRHSVNQSWSRKVRYINFKLIDHIQTSRFKQFPQANRWCSVTSTRKAPASSTKLNVCRTSFANCNISPILRTNLGKRRLTRAAKQRQSVGGGNEIFLQQIRYECRAKGSSRLTTKYKPSIHPILNVKQMITEKGEALQLHPR